MWAAIQWISQVFCVASISVFYCAGFVPPRLKMVAGFPKRAWVIGHIHRKLRLNDLLVSTSGSEVGSVLRMEVW